VVFEKPLKELVNPLCG